MNNHLETCHSESFDALFANPPNAFRGAPFWAWNTKLERGRLLRQIDQFHEMGMGGFHMHVRTGLATEYLGSEFMDHVQACVAKAKELGMTAWLYDEDRYSSGFGGGFVTRHHRFRARHIVFTPRPEPELDRSPEVFWASVEREEKPSGYRLARYDVALDKGFLRSYRRLEDGKSASNQEWWAYMEVNPETPWCNNQTYVDTLNPAAVREFIRVTHDCYAAALGAEFGKTVPAIFTDEPNVSGKATLPYPQDLIRLTIPFTDDFDAEFATRWGESLLGRLPELFWELPDNQISPWRYRYHEQIASRFVASYSQQLADWCTQHGLDLTGHMHSEELPSGQTAQIGDVMRALAPFQRPGIDVLCDRKEFTTAKQAQSLVRQLGRPGLTSELYGVTNWDFGFSGHKAQGDWQAALGVTTRVHHLAWLSAAGEAKRDYPAPIGPQSPWYRQYPLVEDHFARLGLALTRGQPVVRIVVIHPVESTWVAWGPQSQTGGTRDRIDRDFLAITQCLLDNQLDFDYLCEGLLVNQKVTAADGRLQIDAMNYEVVVVPPLLTIRSSTVSILERFSQAGGTVIFAGAPPCLVDALASPRARGLAEKTRRVDFQEHTMVAALEPWREVDIRDIQGKRSRTWIHQLRADGTGRWLFIARSLAVAEANDDWMGRCVLSEAEETLKITLKGTWSVRKFDTITGTSGLLCGEQKDGYTSAILTVGAHDSLLLWWEPGRIATMENSTPAPRLELPLPDLVEYRLSEPNVLLLDQAEFSIGDDAYSPLEEILRIDNIIRQQLDLPLRSESYAQPWVTNSLLSPHCRVRLRFVIHSDLAVEKVRLAIETPERYEIRWNGQRVANSADGYFVDEDIKTIPLPPVLPGPNILEAETQFDRALNLEWSYLLGDFGVAIAGRSCRLTALPAHLAFGDWTGQGLPFYAGNVTYQLPVRLPGGKFGIRVPHFRNPVLSASLDQGCEKPIAFSPFEASWQDCSAGDHVLELTAFGNRINAFGPVHNAAETYRWFGPNAWREIGDAWCYQYRLKATGILSTPRAWVEQ